MTMPFFLLTNPPIIFLVNKFPQRTILLLPPSNLVFYCLLETFIWIFGVNMLLRGKKWRKLPSLKLQQIHWKKKHVLHTYCHDCRPVAPGVENRLLSILPWEILSNFGGKKKQTILWNIWSASNGSCFLFFFVVISFSMCVLAVWYIFSFSFTSGLNLPVFVTFSISYSLLV